jgi:diaminohydroxyphosphoribosylaminopyrimidine deaminase / 5-amino-6-(5-phosphoribosylamino)uracil reductase
VTDPPGVAPSPPHDLPPAPRTDVAPPEAARHLRRALELAELGRGATHPNPMVGCVLVLDAEVVGEGWHARVGGPHAEAAALAAAGARARGATA